MAPRRSSRVQNTLYKYKKGDLVEFNLNGSTAKGKLVKKSARGTWLVALGRFRATKTEEVPEKALGRLIDDDAEDKPKQLRSSTRTTASSKTDDSLNDSPQHNSSRALAATRRGSRGSGTRRTGSGSSAESSKKCKSDESNSSNTNKRKSRMVTFEDAKQPKKKRAANANSIGTRGSTRANGGELLPELPPPTKPKSAIKTALPKVKKNEPVKVIKMLTGTLYLYRGETRRAEFVRSKY
eukprot:scaffold64073_cov76-Cyclotella_meneghiniana.AAC.3